MDFAAELQAEFDLRPRGIIETLDLLRPIYFPTAAYGHFGRDDLNLPWERVNSSKMRTVAENDCIIRKASPDSPIFKRGWFVQGRSSKSLLKDTTEKKSPEVEKDLKEMTEQIAQEIQDRAKQGFM